MSYEIIRSINIKKDGTISVTGASNNVRPLYYSTWTYSNIPQEERMFSMFTAIVSGTYHLQPSVSKRIRYAMLKTNEYIGKNALDTYEIYCDCPKYKYEKLAKEMGLNDFTFERHNYTEEYRKVEESIRDYYFANYSKEEQEKLNYESEHKAYDEIFNVFMNAYNNYVDDKKKWVISMSGRYLLKLNEKTYRTTLNPNNALVLDSVRANEIIGIVKAHCDINAKLVEIED